LPSLGSGEGPASASASGAGFLVQLLDEIALGLRVSRGKRGVHLVCGRLDFELPHVGNPQAYQAVAGTNPLRAVQLLHRFRLGEVRQWARNIPPG